MSSVNEFLSGDLGHLKGVICDSLVKFDGGELFIEDFRSELLSLKDGLVNQYKIANSSGFGLRGFNGTQSAMICSSNVNSVSVKEAASSLSSLAEANNGFNKVHKFEQRCITHSLYTSANSIDSVPFDEKFNLAVKLESMVRERDSFVQHVMVNIATSWQHVKIMRETGEEVSDIRPLFRISLLVIIKNGIVCQGRASCGGRVDYNLYVTDDICEKLVEEAISEARANIEAKSAPAGEMTVVLGSGWPGILLHEAVGHGLEGDFNRKGSSVYSGKIGQSVAAECVTVIDDGTIQNRRGSINIDDEGTPSQRNVLIENGKLVGYMQDRLNANLMGARSTGNGRRDGYDSLIMPRMTNTFMTAGIYTPEEIISSVKFGLYAMNFGGGQVDVTSGNFVFSSSKAYLIENGKITHPVKDFSLIGRGSNVLNSVSMVGNDLKLDDGSGTCSKNGQDIPVGVGQPTVRINSITVGGTGL